jgi:hypothetical protein
MYLVCGEALFDVFSLEAGARSSELALKAIAGGSPFNVAVGLRRLSIDSALFAGISSDFLGARLGVGGSRSRVPVIPSPRTTGGGMELIRIATAGGLNRQGRPRRGVSGVMTCSERAPEACRVMVHAAAESRQRM